MTRWLAVLALAGIACGTRSEDHRQVEPVAEALIESDPAGRTIVAKVDGHPIYGDCVALQATIHDGDIRAALDDCIDFELLAREADRRGYAAAPEVTRARRHAMVRSLVADEYIHTIDEPSDVPLEDLQLLWERQLRSNYNMPERRRATYCRASVKKKAKLGSAADLAGKALAERIYGATRGIHFTPELFAMFCHLAAAPKKAKSTTTATEPMNEAGRHGGGRYAREFAEAAFSVPEIGRVSAPTRTKWGWDLVLVTEIRPAENQTFAEAEDEIRRMLIFHPDTAAYRARKFADWFATYASRAQVEVYPDALADDDRLAAGLPARNP